MLGPTGKLTKDNINFVRSVLNAGTAQGTKSAYRSHLAYWEGWCKEALGLIEIFPLPPEAVLKFIADHLGKMESRLDNRLVAKGIKKRTGPHSVLTVEIRVYVLGLAHKMRGLPSPTDDPMVKQVLANAKRAIGQQSKGKKAVTADILEEMLKTCEKDLRGLRDRALLLVGFASGGRRRSELSAFEYSDLTKSPNGEGFILKIRRSKTDQEGVGFEVPVFGLAADALKKWLKVSNIQSGKLFRAIKRDGSLSSQLCTRQVNRIVKKRLELIGIDSEEYGAHSLRSGFVTESGRQGIAAVDAMALTGHRDFTTFNRYHRAGDMEHNPAAHLMGSTRPESPRRHARRSDR